MPLVYSTSIYVCTYVSRLVSARNETRNNLLEIINSSGFLERRILQKQGCRLLSNPTKYYWEYLYIIFIYKFIDFINNIL